MAQVCHINYKFKGFVKIRVLMDYNFSDKLSCLERQKQFTCYHATCRQQRINNLTL